MSNKKLFGKALIKAILMLATFIVMLIIFLMNGEINNDNVSWGLISLMIGSDVISEIIYESLAERKKKSKKEES